MSTCHLCSQIAGDPAHDLIAQLLPGSAYRRRIVFEDEHLAALPSLGPLVPGHLLLCPKPHLRSLAALPPADWPHLLHAIDRVRGLLARDGLPADGELLLFEHGMARDGQRVPCTVDHAHLHALPLPGGLADGLLPELPWAALPAEPGALAAHTGGQEYLLLWRHGGPMQVALAPPSGHPSQALRQAIARRLQPAPPWNWRDAPQADATDATWARLTQLLPSEPTLSGPA